MEQILQTKSLSFAYEAGNSALTDVSLSIEKGKKTVILGPNGAGKSTLFLHFNGVHKAQKGEVLFEGKPISYAAKPLSLLRSKISLVFQNPDDQIFAPSVEEDIAFGPLNTGLPHAEVERRVVESLSAVGMEEYAQRPTQQLSFGQKKRVALAGALAMDPWVLIMDEPTAGLDSQMVHELLELSEELNHAGKTIVISTHDVETAYEWADNVIVLNRGMHIFSGTCDELFEQSELLHPIGLTPPILFQLNEQRSFRTKEPPSPRPHSLSEAAAKFFPIKNKAQGEKAAASSSSQIAGTLHIVCVDKMEPIAPLSLKIPHENSGIYGLTAQELATRSQMHFHHRFHALEHALLSTSIGEDFVLYSDSALCSLVEKKAKQFSKAAGLQIPIVHTHAKKGSEEKAQQR